MNRKTFYTIFLTVSIFILNIHAQPTTEVKTQLIAKNCYGSLKHNNVGVIESAIFVSIQFKNRFPKEDSDAFIEVLDELAQNSESPIISYKAQLARMYFKNNELFSNIEVRSILDQQKVFEEIAKKINSIMLANNI